MNYRGSYRKLLANSKAAMLAAIEIYNKPQIEYRDECFCILLVNAWQLLTLAILSKKGQRIMYSKKEAGVAYRTYSLTHALRKAKPFFPETIPYEIVRANILHIAEYRDNAIHYYNHSDFATIVYMLAKAAIVLYKDLLQFFFNYDITEDVTLVLLPLGFGNMPDHLEFLRSKKSKLPKNRIVASFMRHIEETTEQLKGQGYDTQRFLMQVDVNLVSVKKSPKADIVVGIDSKSNDAGPSVIVEKIINPNRSHPFKRKDLFEKFHDNINGNTFNSYTLNGVIFTYNVKADEKYCWQAKGGGAMQFSNEFVSFLQSLSREKWNNARQKYSQYLAEKRRKNQTDL